MEPKYLSAMVTGASTGIGRHIALHLSSLGYNLTILDINASALRDTATAARFQGSEVLEVVLDVRDLDAQLAAFERHASRFGGLDLAVLNAGVPELAAQFYHSKIGEWAWDRVLDIDLRSVIGGAQIAGRIMERSGCRGTILCVASAAGVFPVPVTPVYATAKAGVVHFVRSVAYKYQKRGIKVYSICPQFVDTAMGRLVVEAAKDSAAREALVGVKGNMLNTQQVVDLMMDAVQGKYQTGSTLLLLQTGQIVDPFKSKQKSGAAHSSAIDRPPGAQAPAHTVCPNLLAILAAWVQHKPSQYKQIVVHRLSSDFKAATQIIAHDFFNNIPPGQVIVRHVCAGINASDINFSAGRYHKSIKEAQAALPFPAGFEALSVVAEPGLGVSGLQVGQPVVSMSYGAFGEWGIVPAKFLMPVPKPLPKYIALLVSGLTASIALEQAGRLKPGETVLVTAAAGGTGQFAVQLAKLAGCHVIATCGSRCKVELLRGLGADRIVEYKRESLKEVLKQEYPAGVDVVWESIGGEMFNTAVKALAPRGRLIVIGMMSQYKEGWPLSNQPGLAERLMERSATVSGFFLFAYAPLWRSHFQKLLGLEASGKLKVALDTTRFSGLPAVYDAIDHLHSGASVGKVVVHLAEDVPTSTPACKL